MNEIGVGKLDVPRVLVHFDVVTTRVVVLFDTESVLSTGERFVVV